MEMWVLLNCSEAYASRHNQCSLLVNYLSLPIPAESWLHRPVGAGNKYMLTRAGFTGEAYTPPDETTDSTTWRRPYGTWRIFVAIQRQSIAVVFIFIIMHHLILAFELISPCNTDLWDPNRWTHRWVHLGWWTHLGQLHRRHRNPGSRERPPSCFRRNRGKPHNYNYNNTANKIKLDIDQ